MFASRPHPRNRGFVRSTIAKLIQNSIDAKHLLKNMNERNQMTKDGNVLWDFHSHKFCGRRYFMQIVSITEICIK